MLACKSQRPRLPIRELRIGGGVFLRGFVDGMIDVANEDISAGPGVAVTLARPPALAARDSLFTVWERELANDEVVERRRMVGGLQAAFDPHAAPQKLRGLAALQNLGFVVSSATQAGIARSDEPWAQRLT